MPFIGNQPAKVPLTSADITDGIITSAKIADGTIVNADINDSAAIVSTKLSGVGITLGTAVASTSGTSIDFTSLPSNAKRITVMFYRISTNGTSSIQVQLGDSGGVETTGYEVTSIYLNAGAVDADSFTSGFVFRQVSGFAAQDTQSGQIILNKIDGNKWTGAGSLSWYNVDPILINAGSKELSATLDRVRITTVNGTDTFDAGSINIMYE